MEGGKQLASALVCSNNRDKEEAFCDPKLRMEFNFEKVLSARTEVICHRIFMNNNLSQIIVL